MSVSYEDALARVRAALEPEWTIGTFCVDDREITENEKMFVFSVGAREDLVDGDHSYAIVGSVPVVYKRDGRVDSLPSVAVAMDDTLTVRANPNPTLA